MTSPSDKSRSTGRFSRAKRVAASSRERLRRLTLDALEPRTLMSVLPPPQILTRTDVSNTPGSEDTAPSISVDPLDPLRAVAVWSHAQGTEPIGQGQYARGGRGGVHDRRRPDLVEAHGRHDRGLHVFAAVAPARPRAGQADDDQPVRRRDRPVGGVRSPAQRLRAGVGAHGRLQVGRAGAPEVQLHGRDAQPDDRQQDRPPVDREPERRGGLRRPGAQRRRSPSTPASATAQTNEPAGTPAGIVTGPDGNTYVAVQDQNQVQQLQGSTGQFTTIFASGGGLRVPSQLAFNPQDGDLYISNLPERRGAAGRRHDGREPGHVHAGPRLARLCPATWSSARSTATFTSRTRAPARSCATTRRPACSSARSSRPTRAASSSRRAWRSARTATFTWPTPRTTRS